MTVQRRSWQHDCSAYDVGNGGEHDEHMMVALMMVMPSSAGEMESVKAMIESRIHTVLTTMEFPSIPVFSPRPFGDPAVSLRKSSTILCRRI